MIHFVLENLRGEAGERFCARSEHGFDSVEHAQTYLESRLFNEDVATGLKPTWSAEPKIAIYSVA